VVELAFNVTEFDSGGRWTTWIQLSPCRRGQHVPQLPNKLALYKT